MGPDDILNGIHTSFFILFARTGFPRIGGTSPHFAFRWDLSTATLYEEAIRSYERLRKTTALQVTNGYRSFDRDLEAPGPSAPPNPVARTSRFHFDGSLPAGHDSFGSLSYRFLF